MFKLGFKSQVGPLFEAAGFIVRSLVLPAALTDTNAQLKEINPAMEELTGFREDELAGAPLARLFSGGVYPAVQGLLAAALKNDRVENLRANISMKDGSKTPVEVSASVIRDPQGEPFIVLTVKDLSQELSTISTMVMENAGLSRRIDYLEGFRSGIFEMLKDIDRSETELEKAYIDLKNTQTQLIQSTKLTALGELSAALAHELNQPVTVIKGLSQNLMCQFKEAGNFKEKVTLINEAAKKMESVISHLMIFSRAEVDGFKPTDLNKVVENALLMIREVLLKNSIEIRLDLNEPPLVMGSANRLEQVILNVAVNAKDAMPQGGVFKISTDGVEKGGRAFATMSLVDTGAGIPEEYIGRIFDPFFTTKEAGKGTGLGLSISYGIIKEHGGEMTVKSRPGSGTAFHITIPAV